MRSPSPVAMQPSALVSSMLAALSLYLPVALGHGMLTYPMPRQRCQKEHALNWKGDGVGGNGGGMDGPTGGMPSFCGDPFNNFPDSDFVKWPCETMAVFEEGSTIDISTYLAGNHGGHFQFAVCPESNITQECFDKYTLRDAFHGGVSWFLPKYDRTDPYTVSRMVLPEGLVCEKCVFLWTWWAAHICVYDCDPVECGPYSKRFNPGTTDEAERPDTWEQPLCPQVPSKGQDPQIYRNCADIKIVPKGTPITMPKKVLKEIGSVDSQTDMHPSSKWTAAWNSFPSVTFTGTVTQKVTYSTLTTTAVGAAPHHPGHSRPPNSPPLGGNAQPPAPPLQPPSYPPPPLSTPPASNPASHTLGSFLNSRQRPPPPPQQPPSYASPSINQSTTTQLSSTTTLSKPSGWGAFYSSAARRLAAATAMARTLQAKRTTEGLFKDEQYGDGLQEKDERGLAAITAVSDGTFHCGNERVRNVLTAVNGERLRTASGAPLLCSNKATGAAHNLAKIMCAMRHEMHNRKLYCGAGELGEDCLDMVMVGGQEALASLSHTDRHHLLGEWGTAAGVGYVDCKDNLTYWAVLLG